MAEYTPRVITFGRALQTWAVEEDFRLVAELLGGSAYLNGAPWSAARGALTEVNLAPSIRIGNSYKAAAYSAVAIPLYVDDPGVGSSVVFRIGGITKLQAKTTVQRAGIAFSYTSGGVASGTVTVNWTGTVTETLTFNNLAALTLATTAAKATLGATDHITVTLANTAGSFAWGCVTLRLLVKHVS